MKLRNLNLFLAIITLSLILLLSLIYFSSTEKDLIYKRVKKSLNFKELKINKLKNYNIKKISISIEGNDFKSFQKEQVFFSKEKWLDRRKINYYKCKLKIGNNNFNGKIRLKGLLLKPWEYEDGFYSYKVKLKNKKINNIDRFYLNYPKKRNNLHEFYGDQICKYFGLIYQRNFFYSLEINEIKKGLYLFEEAFDEDLLLHNKRPVGPIIYYTKDNLIEMGIENYRESFFSSKIKHQFSNKHNKIAKNLLDGFIKKEYSAQKVFDFEKTATHFALADLIGYFHQLNYHNVKFYYNPLSGKIEPIANDFQFYFLKNWTKESFGIVFNKQNYDPKYIDYFSTPWMKILFNNNDFFEIYLKKLSSITKAERIDSLFNFMRPDEDTAKAIISTFDPKYDSKVRFIIEQNAKQIRLVISNYLNDDKKSIYMTDSLVLENDF